MKYTLAFCTVFFYWVNKPVYAQAMQVTFCMQVVELRDTLILNELEKTAFTFENARWNSALKGIKVQIYTLPENKVKLELILKRGKYKQLSLTENNNLIDCDRAQNQFCSVVFQNQQTYVPINALFEFVHSQLKR